MSSITSALQKLLDIRKTKGFPIDDDFQPGLSRETIDILTEHVPFRLPDELYAVYQWRNGIPDEREFCFLFRDHRFLPLEEAVIVYQEIVTYYPPRGDEINLRLCFPFAGFEGSSYCLPSETHPPIRGCTRPVMSVFEGVELYFSSFTALLETVTEWFETGVHTPAGVDVEREAELRIWNTHNPGILA